MLPVMKVPFTWLEPVTVLKLPDAPKTWLASVSPTTVRVPARAFPMTVDVCDKTVWKPGEPHVSVAEGFTLMILPVVWMLDILTVAPIELTERLLISADLACRVDTVRVEGSRKLGGG